MGAESDHTQEVIDPAVERDRVFHEKLKTAGRSVVRIKIWPKSYRYQDGNSQDLVEDYQPEGAGTGFIVAVEGNELIIMTNAHVAQTGARFTIKFRADTYQKELKAEPFYVDPDADVALLRVSLPAGESVDAPALKFASKVPDVGERVGTIGFPFMPDMMGQVRNISRVTADPMDESEVSPTDSEAHKRIKKTFKYTGEGTGGGNSGGPVLNEDGEVAGMHGFGPSGAHNARYGAAISGTEILTLAKYPKIFAEIQQTIWYVINARKNVVAEEEHQRPPALMAIFPNIISEIRRIIVEHAGDAADEVAREILLRDGTNGVRRMIKKDLLKGVRRKDFYQAEFVKVFGVNLYEDSELATNAESKQVTEPEEPPMVPVADELTLVQY